MFVTQRKKENAIVRGRLLLTMIIGLWWAITVVVARSGAFEVDEEPTAELIGAKRPPDFDGQKPLWVVKSVVGTIKSYYYSPAAQGVVAVMPEQEPTIGLIRQCNSTSECFAYSVCDFYFYF